MKLPKLDLFQLPDLDILTGVFGMFASDPGPGHDDTVVILAIFVYESTSSFVS